MWICKVSPCSKICAWYKLKDKGGFKMLNNTIQAPHRHILRYYLFFASWSKVKTEKEFMDGKPWPHQIVS